MSRTSKLKKIGIFTLALAITACSQGAAKSSDSADLQQLSAQANVPAAVNNEASTPELLQKTYPVQQISPQLQVQQLADGLWLHVSTQTLSNGETFTSNGLIVRTEQQLWLLDTAWGNDLTEQLLSWLAAEVKLPVTLAIATHYHADRTGGATTLARHGIPLYATAHTRQLALAEKELHVLALTDLKPGDTFAQGPVQWFYPGAGHAPDNIVLWLEQYQLLVGGCAVKAPRFPGLGYTGNADLKEWPLSLQRIARQYPQIKYLVPGHGDIGDATLLDYSLALFPAEK